MGPAPHPVHIPALFFEAVWDTKELNKLWPEGGEQPYVLSMGDPWVLHLLRPLPDCLAKRILMLGLDAASTMTTSSASTCTNISGPPAECTELTLQTDE